MKNLFSLLLLVIVFAGCSKDDARTQNPYLPNYNFEVNINLELPLYAQLNFPSNPMRIFPEGGGINGIILMNTGGAFVAWEATCPNQPITSCSLLELNGVNALCPCDNVEYSLYTGYGAAQYPLKQYRVEMISSTYIRVSN